MLRNKSRLEALDGVEELDNRAAETIWGGTFDLEKLPEGTVILRPVELKPNIDYPGNDFLMYWGGDLEVCKRSCVENLNCAGFT